jgi:hypothetical protein
MVKLQGNTIYAYFSELATPSNFAFRFYNVSAPLSNNSAPGPVLLQSGPDVTLWNTLHDQWGKSPIVKFKATY